MKQVWYSEITGRMYETASLCQKDEDARKKSATLLGAEADLRRAIDKCNELKVWRLPAVERTVIASRKLVEEIKANPAGKRSIANGKHLSHREKRRKIIEAEAEYLRLWEHRANLQEQYRAYKRAIRELNAEIAKLRADEDKELMAATAKKKEEGL